MCLLVFCRLGWLLVACVFLSFFFMSIMFPTIFALGIFGLGARAKKAAAYIVMAIMGGALLPKVMGLVLRSLYALTYRLLLKAPTLPGLRMRCSPSPRPSP
jgi:fucose permease